MAYHQKSYEKCPQCEEALAARAAGLVQERTAQWGTNQAEYDRLTLLIDEVNGVRNLHTLVVTLTTETRPTRGLTVYLRVVWECTRCGLRNSQLFTNSCRLMEPEPRWYSEDAKALPIGGSR